MSRTYSVQQITDTDPIVEEGIFTMHLNAPSLSVSGNRMTFLQRFDPEGVRPGYVIRCYDAERGVYRPRVRWEDGHEMGLGSDHRPAISGDGRWLVFDSRNTDYIGEGEGGGIFRFDLETESIRHIVKDNVEGRHLGPIRPSTNDDGSWISFVQRLPDRDMLILSQVGPDRVRGGDILSVVRRRGSTDFGIFAQSINGHHAQSTRTVHRCIAFYAKGPIQGIQVENIDVPHNDDDDEDEESVYCYVAVILGVNRYRLLAVPDPSSPTDPLVIQRGSGNNSFNSIIALADPPRISRDGNQVALHAGFVNGSEKTGTYVFNLEDAETHPIIMFPDPPGEETRTMQTGVHPAISGNGRWLAYYKRTVRFFEGYPDEEPHCPTIGQEDLVVARRIPIGEEVMVTPASECVKHSHSLGLDVNNDATSVAFLSARDVGDNPDGSHEVFIAEGEDS